MRPIRVRVPSIVTACVFLAATGCTTPPLASPEPESFGQGASALPQSDRNQVDVLFVIDNSGSMDAMSAELRNRFGDLLDTFRTLAAAGRYVDLQLGVVTTDYGAGATGAPGCTASSTDGGGHQGRLQAIGQAAQPGCKRPVGGNFVRYAFHQGGADVHNLPAGQDLESTFTCMASVGTSGCGFEHVLESAYAALHNPIPDNRGFLRPEALLVVVFLTNEDDCSAPPASRLFDKNETARFGHLSSYRCTRFGVVCDEGMPPYGPGAGVGAMHNCRPAPNPDNDPNLLYDVDRYTRFFTRSSAQGGVKDDPRDVVLVGLAGPDAPFETRLGNPGSPSPTDRCGSFNESSNPPCVSTLALSCRNEQQPVFHAFPATRLNHVIRAAAHHALIPICGNDYRSAMSEIGKLVVIGLGDGCLPDRFPRDAAGRPIIDCVVRDETLAGDGTVLIRDIPSCADAPGTTCYRVEPKPACIDPESDGYALTVERPGGPAAPRTTSRVYCATRP